MLYIFPGINYVCGDDTNLVGQHHPLLIQSNITINQFVSQIEGGDWRRRLCWPCNCSMLHGHATRTAAGSYAHDGVGAQRAPQGQPKKGKRTRKHYQTL